MRKGLDRLRSALIGLARPTDLSSQVRERAREAPCRRHSSTIRTKKLARFLNHVLALSDHRRRLAPPRFPQGPRRPSPSHSSSARPKLNSLSRRRRRGRNPQKNEARLVCMAWRARAARAAIHQGMKRVSGILRLLLLHSEIRRNFTANEDGPRWMDGWAGGCTSVLSTLHKEKQIDWPNKDHR